MRGIAKVDEDSFRVSNMQIPIGFRRESRVHVSASGGKMLISEVRMKLGVPARFV